MAMLGFDALGGLALGQLPGAQQPPVGQQWSTPLKAAGLTAAVLATTFVGFVPPPSQAATPIFTPFSQPLPATKLVAHLHTQPVFETTRVILAVTPGPASFTKFSEPLPSRRLPAHLHTQPIFEIVPIVAAAVTPASVFTRFSEPYILRLKPQQPGFGSAPFVPPNLALLGDYFSEFELPPKPRLPQTGFTNAPLFIGAAQTFVFSTFDQPLVKRAAQFDQASRFTIGPPAAPFVQTYIFSPYEQPIPRKYPSHAATVQFEILQPPPFIYEMPPFSGWLSFDIPPQFNRTMPKGLTAEGVAMTVIFTPNIDTSGPDDWLTRARRRGRR